MKKINVFLTFVLFVFFLSMAVCASAQTCEPKQFSLIFLDSAGKIIAPDEIKLLKYTRFDKKDKKTFVAKAETLKITDKKTEIDNEYGALSFIRSPDAECFYTIGTLTLERDGQTMKLVINSSPENFYSGGLTYQYKHIPVARVTFQSGTFQFIKPRYADNEFIPAEWKKIEDKVKSAKSKQ